MEHPMKKHALTTAMSLNASQLSRASAMAKDTCQLAVTPPDPDTIAEARELAKATVERATEMQKSWMAGWDDWLEYTQTLAGADTMPKFMAHSGNIMLRAQAQMLAQMTDMSGLAENFSVSYSFWVHKQINNR